MERNVGRTASAAEHDLGGPAPSYVYIYGVVFAHLTPLSSLGLLNSLWLFLPGFLSPIQEVLTAGEECFQNVLFCVELDDVKR